MNDLHAGANAPAAPSSGSSHSLPVRKWTSRALTIARSAAGSRAGRWSPRSCCRDPSAISGHVYSRRTEPPGCCRAQVVEVQAHLCPCSRRPWPGEHERGKFRVDVRAQMPLQFFDQTPAGKPSSGPLKTRPVQGYHCGSPLTAHLHHFHLVPHTQGCGTTTTWIRWFPSP